MVAMISVQCATYCDGEFAPELLKPTEDSSVTSEIIASLEVYKPLLGELLGEEPGLVVSSEPISCLRMNDEHGTVV